MKKVFSQTVLLIALLSTAAIAQAQQTAPAATPAPAAAPAVAPAPKPVDHSYKPLTLKLNEDGSKYLRIIMWHQMWVHLPKITRAQ